ncbi:hypothetical protein [Agarilytica rhodophyticola]|uniref:hypothetical protein n=1 Tax=Agarilytica rhodophyticola TaxID=1737490 RepID=UPI000B3470D4|nr:hypothetical protein [Agarilytica rhodophyticola]
MIPFQTSILACLITFSSISVFASGSGSFGYGRQEPVQRITDPAYEYGKALFKGRNKKYKKVKFCTVSEEAESGVTKIKGKTMKPFRKSTYQKVASTLRNCAQPDQAAHQLLTNDDLFALVYYIDKRYRLKLK